MLKSNRLRGPQKLKYYCELCRKQCKDEHGWKCHINSYTHQNNVREFAENPQENIEKFSKKFETGFIQLMRDRYGNVRKKANDIYMQFIDDRNHVHMNATKWPTLSAFCQHLKGFKNIAVEEKQQIYLTYLEVDASSFKKQADSHRHQETKAKQDDAEWKLMEKQLIKAKELEKKEEPEKEDELLQPISLDFKIDLGQKDQFKRPPQFVFEDFEQQATEGPIKYKKKCTNADKLLSLIKPRAEEGEWVADKPQQLNPEQFSWVIKGIVVKILPHDIPERYHNKKATVVSVTEDFVAQLQLNDVKMQVDQTYLQTVIPKEGSDVIVLKGTHRGQRAIVDRLYPEEGYAIVVFMKGGKDYTLNLPCDQFSKAA